jgi:phosphoribosylamine--glycine ligase
MKILVTGKGGREHAILTALSESPSQPRLFAWPGSDAIASLATRVDVPDLDGLIAFMQSEAIDLCVAGEEAWLVKDEGLANMCETAGIPCWGPRKESAQLEASKTFAKLFLQRHGIPTAGFTVCQSKVETCLTGPEISIFVSVCDDQYHILMPARDYKRIRDNDQGPNTGGMGAVASRELADAALMEQIEAEVVKPTVQGLIKDGLRYRGFLYCGLMLTPKGPMVIEYNCRFGDPEAEAVLPMVRGDFEQYCFAAAKGALTPGLISFAEGWSVCVILASAGYPASSRSGDAISGLDQAVGAKVFHCGTRQNAAGVYETNGGRVLAVVAQGTTRNEARDLAYANAGKISFDGRQSRTDIAKMHFE